MTPPQISRDLFDMPGDAVARPHANCYWLVPGRILAGEHPGAVTAAEVPGRVDALLDAGIRRFVDLTEEFERPAPYAHTLRERAAMRSIDAVHRRFAIRDFGVPSAPLMRTILDVIYESLEKRDPVYVHCWAGVGRTGTVVGCLLREQGFAAADALALIARKWGAMGTRDRHPRSPEWPDQFSFIERWPDGEPTGHGCRSKGTN
jgi:hypothetical protein